jgi:hypothetical protein
MICGEGSSYWPTLDKYFCLDMQPNMFTENMPQSCNNLKSGLLINRIVKLEIRRSTIGLVAVLLFTQYDCLDSVL